jgi:CBS domain-containing protein
MHKAGFDAGGKKRKPITLRPEQTLLDARNIMIKYNISRVVVVKNRRPLGLVTEKDMARFLYQDVPAKGLGEIRLDEVMSKELITVEPETDLRTCARMMLSNHVSSLLVIDIKNNLKGIFTKTDLATAYEEYFVLERQVKEFMTRKVVTVAPDEPIHSAMILMNSNQISRIIVVKNGQPVGIITGRDLLALGAYFATPDHRRKKGVYSPFIPSGVKAFMLASDVMTAKPISTTPDSDLADAAYIMLRNRISGLPVIDSKGILTGLITKTDVIRALASHE